MNFFELSEFVRAQKELEFFEATMLPAPPPPPRRKGPPEGFTGGFLPTEDELDRRDQSSRKALGYVMKNLKASKPAIFDIAMRAMQGKSGHAAYLAARQAVMAVNPQLWQDIVNMKGVQSPPPPPVPGSRAEYFAKLKHPSMPAPPPPPTPKRGI